MGKSYGKFLREKEKGKSQFKKGSDWWTFSIWNRVMGSEPIRIQLGKILWENLVGKSCGKILWDILAGICCGKFLWENLVGNSCRKFLRENLAGYSCRNLLWENLAGKCCAKILRDILAGICCGKILPEIVAGKSWVSHIITLSSINRFFFSKLNI